MDNRDIKKNFGEWLCSLSSSPIVKSAIHADLSSMYHQDFIIVSNLCNGYGYMPQISITVIDGTKEWYKQANKDSLKLPICQSRRNLQFHWKLTKMLKPKNRDG